MGTSPSDRDQDPGPAADEGFADAPAETAEDDAAEARPVVRVLIVDDEDDLRATFATALAQDGFEVVGEAGSAAEALDLASAEPKPDIVLLDLHMPDMGGLELLPLLQERTPASKFVICSAISASYMLEATMDAGASAFVVKGVPVVSLVEHLRRVARALPFTVVRPYPLNRGHV